MPVVRMTFYWDVPQEQILCGTNSVRDSFLNATIFMASIQESAVICPPHLHNLTYCLLFIFISLSSFSQYLHWVALVFLEGVGSGWLISSDKKSLFRLLCHPDSFTCLSIRVTFRKFWTELKYIIYPLSLGIFRQVLSVLLLLIRHYYLCDNKSKCQEITSTV